MYYLIRTGNVKEASIVAMDNETVLQRSEDLFVTFIKAWADSLDRRYALSLIVWAQTFSSLVFHYRLPTQLRDRLMAMFNSHVLHARDVDPFKIALFRIIGRIDAQRRNIPLVIGSTEDWAWFQLIMVCVHSKICDGFY
jgi:nuclear pore complex protein Nup93